eukprot:321342_1
MSSSVHTLVEKIKFKYFTKRSNPLGSRDNSQVSLNIDLIDFLSDGKHYAKFALYLVRLFYSYIKPQTTPLVHIQIQSNCFALENLSFLETIIVFHNALLLSMERDVKKEYRHKFLNRLFDLKFNYLEQLNHEFIEQINKGNIEDLSFKIYETFISSSSESTINISWDVRNGLNQFFNKKDRINASQNENQLKSVYLDLFNSAILEIYALLDTRYSTDFRNYKTITNDA